MQKDFRFFDDFSKLASGATGTFMDMKRELQAMMTDMIESMLGKMHLVRRDEFDVVRLMVEQARVEQENLKEKLAEIEKLLESNKSI